MPLSKVSQAGVQFSSFNPFSRVLPISASVGSNALTVTLNPCTIDFRSSTLGSGTVNTRTVTTAISMTVSSGSTLGTSSAIASRIAVLAIDNAGTVELAVVNILGGNQLDETNLINTTAEGAAGAADSATVIYSTAARSNVPYRIVGFIDSTQATAGTWATAPSTIQGVGGQALAAMSSIGYGQTWQSPSRSAGTTYYNTTGKPILIAVSGRMNALNTHFTYIYVSGILVTYAYGGGGASNAFFDVPGIAIVPPGATYSVTNTGGIAVWAELR